MWKAPVALLAQHQSSHPPPVPPGGWVAAVRAAVAPLEAEMTEADILADEPSSAQAPGSTLFPQYILLINLDSITSTLQRQEDAAALCVEDVQAALM